MTAPRCRAGFVGLGDMGSRMAIRIAQAGIPLRVYDPRPEPMDELAGHGAVLAADAGEVARDCDVVGICVVTVEQLRAVVEQMAPHLAGGTVVCVHSTLAPSAVRDVAVRVEHLGGHLLDAPVSGSRPAADAGTLTVIVGGAAEDLASARPVLDSYATSIFHVGGIGAGQTLKLTNNVMLHMNHLVALEAVRFALDQGVAEDAVLAVVNASTGRSWVTETWGLIDDMLFDHPQAGTAGLYSMMSKDMWEAVVTSREQLTELPLTAAGVQLSRGYLEDREALLRVRRGSAESQDIISERRSP